MDNVSKPVRQKCDPGVYRESRLLAELNFRISLRDLQTPLQLHTHTHKSNCLAPPTSFERQGGRQTDSAAWACWSKLDCLPAQLLSTSLNYHNAAVWRSRANSTACLCVWKCVHVYLTTFICVYNVFLRVYCMCVCCRMLEWEV